MEAGRPGRQAEKAREIVNQLGLSARQLRELLPIAVEAAELHTAIHAAEARLHPEALEAFRAFAREDSLNQGFSQQVERRTADIHRQEKEAREQITAELIDLEQQALEILTPEQRQAVEGTAQGVERRRDGAGRQARRPLAGRPPPRNFAPVGTSGDPLEVARQEFVTLRAQIHPEAGPVGRMLLHPAAAEAMCRLLGTRPNQDIRDAGELAVNGAPDYPAARREADREELARLRDEISNWNLINGLHLSGRQISQIVAIYDASMAAKQAPAQGKRGGPVRGIRGHAEALSEIEQAVAKVLNPGQLEVLKDFKPCLLPPKNLKDPVRVGQANDNSHHEQWLSRVRKMPRWRWSIAAQRLLGEEEKRLRALDETERSERLRLLTQTIREAAAMSDVEFELSRGDLAARIAPADRVGELIHEIVDLSQDRGEPAVISWYMLRPQFINQLRVRGRQLAKGIVHEPTRLSEGPQADDCDKGCAVKPGDKKGNAGQAPMKPRRSRKAGTTDEQ